MPSGDQDDGERADKIRHAAREIASWLMSQPELETLVIAIDDGPTTRAVDWMPGYA
jgi:hypothetical protein